MNDYRVDGIAYAGNLQDMIEVMTVIPLPNYTLRVKFTNGEIKTFDFKPYLDKPVYTQLKDEEIFKAVYVDSGIPVWCDGDIDIAPERLYYDGVSAAKTA